MTDGLKAEGDRWDVQAGQMFQAALQLSTVDLPAGDAGPLQEFVDAYRQQVTRVRQWCKDGNKSMHDVADALHTAAKKYASMDVDLERNYQQITEVT
jgi:hypothetical protein